MSPEEPIPLSVVREEDAGEIRVRVSGEVDLRTSDLLLGALSPGGDRRIALDLADMTFIDSTGLSALIAARKAGADIVLRNPPPQMQKLLSITGLASEFPVVD